jgi:DNA-binding IclR family transcriptional regulator
MTVSTSLNAERALDILLVMGEVGPEGLSVSQITARVGGGKSAVHRSLMALLHKGFIEASGRYGHYRLGPAVPMLARRHERLEPQIERLRPGMTEFARRTGFTVYLMIQAGVDAVCAEMVSRSTRRHFKMGVGARVPMGVAAGSMALLSMLAPDAAQRIITGNSDRFAQYPSLRHIDASIIADQVAVARAKGYAVNMGYYLPGEGGLGLPLAGSGPFDIDMAISFNAPLEMMTVAWMDGMIHQLRDCITRNDRPEQGLSDDHSASQSPTHGQSAGL